MYWFKPYRISINSYVHKRQVISFYFRSIGYANKDFRGMTDVKKKQSIITINGKHFERDEFTNATLNILSYLGRDLHLMKSHPLCLLKNRIVNFMYGKYVNRRGNPLFSIHDKLPPIASVEYNFDSLLVPVDHVSRKKSDTYFINKEYVLRTHTSAHQKELLMSGLNNFLVIGDVYRRDQIDSTHYPVFHQADAVRLFSRQELFNSVKDSDQLSMFQKSDRRPEHQEVHTLEAVKIMEVDLKDCLSSLVKRLFGQDVQYKWTEAYFPFTHPSWELEVLWNGDWLEILGCGIMEQKILDNAGAGEKVGWAFGLGLERLAMLLYDIPDIRLFWSRDTGFLSQFDVKDVEAPIKYKPISRFPQCSNDISFWVPPNFHANDFYDLVRTIGGSIIEQVSQIDEFFHPKHKKPSLTFRIVYRHMERPLTQAEVNIIHKNIGDMATQELGIEVRGA